MSEAVSESYARALVELAQERGQLPEIEEAARAFAEALRHDRDLRSCIENPGIDRHQKRAVLVRELDPILPSLFVDFLAVVTEKGRDRMLPQMLVHVQDLVDKAAGRIRLLYVSASAAGSAERERVAAALGTHLGMEVIIEHRVDPAILGGMVLRYQDQVLDGSVRGKLQRLREHLLARRFGSEYVDEDQS